MNIQESVDFARITEAIEYIRQDFKRQPHLDDIAKKVGLSPAHFQRMFTNWAGVSPKKFLQYTTIGYAKKMLKESHSSLLDTAYEAGLSGTGRLHDLFIQIEGMTPGEYKNGGEKLSINYSFAKTLFGELIVASTSKGICYMAFANDSNNHQNDFDHLRAIFPNASYQHQSDTFQRKALSFFSGDWSNLEKIKCHLKGSDFQLKVWETLLKIPMGKLTTYGEIANRIDKPKATRAVGTAIGSNPVSILIPCHRVIRSSGEMGGYHWGIHRKIALLGWEASRNERDF